MEESKFSSFPTCTWCAVCIPNDAGTPKPSSMEGDDEIPTNFNKQDQGHRLLSVEVSHRSSSSLNFEFV